MKIPFHKISATGNDFLIIDNRQSIFVRDSLLISGICDRNSGIGSDGVVLLESSEAADFKMVFFNPDGSRVGMCGNAGRAVTFFAHHILKMKSEGEYFFETLNSRYHSKINGDWVELQMSELRDVGKIDLAKFSGFLSSMFLNTGVEHAVFQVDDLANFPVEEVGRKIRYDKIFENGTNVDFFQVDGEGKLSVRTYERGVEGETLSCGTGVTAVAIAASKMFGMQKNIEINTRGGLLKVSFDRKLTEIILAGKVEVILEGSFDQ